MAPSLDSTAEEPACEAAAARTDSNEERKPPANPTPKKRRLTREIADYNIPATEAVDVVAEEVAVVVAAVSPSPETDRGTTTTTPTTPPKQPARRSARVKTEVVRLFDPSDGSELDDEGGRRGRKSKKEETTSSYRQVINKIQKGNHVCKKFLNADGREQYYKGKVKDDTPIIDSETGTIRWRIQYEDDDVEDLDKTEVLRLIQFEAARKTLCNKMGTSESEVLAALEKMDPPYDSLNQAMRLIHFAKQDPSAATNVQEEAYKKFDPKIGLKISRNYDGATYIGVVTKDFEYLHSDDTGEKIKTWEVTYEDGTNDDMEYNELFQFRANRPNRPHPSVGRQMCLLELFSGQGIVTQAFADRRYRVQSIDNNPKSDYPTMRKDIMKIKYKDILMVPDVIWASPPCSTYSRLAGTTHRDVPRGQYDKSPEAKLHNLLLLQMKVIMEWSLRRNPHLIMVIENPEANLRHMPLMQEISNQLGLHKVTVHYCAFGAAEKKPTNLWTNDLNLRSRLNEFKCCEERCPYYKSGNEHPRGARGNKQNYNTAVVPAGLAELVATYVDAKFIMDRVNAKKEVIPTKEDIEELNRKLQS